GRPRDPADSAAHPDPGRALVVDQSVARVHHRVRVRGRHAGRRVRAAAPEGRVSTARAEWTKLRTVPSTGWLLLGAVVPAVALGVLMAESPNVSRCTTPTACEDDLT